MPKEKSISTLAKEILYFSQKALCGELHSLLRGITSLGLKETEMNGVFTDGIYFFYNPRYIITKFKSNQNTPTRAFLHTLFHCIFLHVFNTQFKNKDYWNLACDICVEKFINDTDLLCTRDEKTKRQKHITNMLSKKIKNFTAENVYNYLANTQIPRDEFSMYSDLFCNDFHDVWYNNNFFKNANKTEEDEEVEARSIYKFADERGGDYQTGKNNSTDNTVNSNAENSEKWREITKKIIRDEENNPSVIGSSPGLDTARLKAVTRDKYDYSEFIKKFTAETETLEINHDEFDYIYYTHGLNLYGNIPLIEPLEYTENNQIKKLIIAIDTSGSVEGEPVKKFIEKTYSILKTTDFFKKDTEIHILQCDCQLQSVGIIKTPDELEKFINTLTLKGFGGTDFRPVFAYANELCEKTPNESINGIIYFTDGDGIYPQAPPPCKTAFIINDNGFDKSKIPKWAISIYIE